MTAATFCERAWPTYPDEKPPQKLCVCSLPSGHAEECRCPCGRSPGDFA